MSTNRKQTIFAYKLLMPTVILFLVLIGYPIVYNIILSFNDQPLNPKLPSEFVGFENYLQVLSDPEFYASLLITLAYTVCVVLLSTSIGLFVAVFMDRDFVGKKIIKPFVMVSYIIPSISLVFLTKYMHNNIYGIINYIFVDVLGIFETAPLWFDDPLMSFVIVVVFATWRFFPYAFMSFDALLQTIDRTLYEAADIDGANEWNKFKSIVFPSVLPILITIVTLRTIWSFYMFDEVYLLTSQVNLVGIYLYEQAFAINDLSGAAAMSVILSIIIFTFIIFIRKKEQKNED